MAEMGTDMKLADTFLRALKATGKVQKHADGGGRAYNRTVHLAERKRMMCRWAEYLDGLRAQIS